MSHDNFHIHFLFIKAISPASSLRPSLSANMLENSVIADRVDLQVSSAFSI